MDLVSGAFEPWATFTLTFWPSVRELRPERSSAVAWTNTSFPPSARAINPNPFWELYHFTDPSLSVSNSSGDDCGQEPSVGRGALGEIAVLTITSSTSPTCGPFCPCPMVTRKRAPSGTLL